MAWYRHGYYVDDDDDDDDRYDHYEEIAVSDDAIRFEGPLEAQSRRGAIGATWWGEQWVAAMQRLGGARLDRGKTYARNGRVKDLTIQHGMAFARVQGSRRRPYQSRFSLKTLTPDEWRRVLDALAAEAIHAAKLLAGEMPSDIERIFQGLGLSLFPRSSADISFHCSCPDWGDPCKHCAAIYYLVAERLDADPFILFHLRGYTRERVLEELRLRRAGVGQGAGAASAVGQRAVEALDVDANAFWPGGAELPALPAPAMPAQSPLMARRGAPPAGEAREWASVYRQIAETALAWLGNAREEEPPPPPDDGGAERARPAEEPPWSLYMEDVALLADRQQRRERVLVDAYGPDEELVAFETYLDTALETPFEALWRDPDEPGHEEPVTVLGVHGSDDRRGILLRVRRRNRERRLVAEQVWALDKDSPNATALDDYREWIGEGGGRSR